MLPEVLLRRMDREFETCDHILVPSNVSRQSFAERGFEKKTIVVLTGVDSDFFSPPAPSEKPVFRVCYVGRVQMAKGVAYLLAIDSRTGKILKNHTYPKFYCMLAYEPSLKVIIALSWNFTTKSSTLSKINPADLTSTPIGPYAPGYHIYVGSPTAYDSVKKIVYCYMGDSKTDEEVVVGQSLASGAVTTFPLDKNFYNRDLFFDNVTGKLFCGAQNRTAGSGDGNHFLATVDTVTGKVSRVGKDIGDLGRCQYASAISSETRQYFVIYSGCEKKKREAEDGDSTWLVTLDLDTGAVVKVLKNWKVHLDQMAFASL